MSLTNDVARCSGQDCPSATNCKRYTERGSSDRVCHAAFWARREAGSTACESYLPVELVSTFKEP